MDVIVTHDVSDFDGIAASVAARKLYPDARMLRRRILSGEVRSYLAIHGGRFEFEPFEDVDQDAVQRLIMVDVRRRSRLEPDFQSVLARADAGDPGLALHIYDHHPDSEDDLHGEVEVVETMGAVTTAFCEILQQRGLELDPVEATLMALGIYSDTGSLTYSNTIPRDVEAVAWLLRQGANLELVSRFLRPQFGQPQRDLLSRILSGMELVRVGTTDVGVSIVPLRRSVNGMPIVTTHACQISDARVVFGVFPVGSRRVQIIGRSDHGCVDIGEVMKSLGGGGHSDAGSTTLRGVSGEEAKQALLRELQARAEHDAAAAGLMRAPGPGARIQKGRTLEVSANFDDAVNLMARRNLERIVIVDGREIVGEIHRDDLMERLYATDEPPSLRDLAAANVGTVASLTSEPEHSKEA